MPFSSSRLCMNRHIFITSSCNVPFSSVRFSVKKCRFDGSHVAGCSWIYVSWSRINPDKQGWKELLDSPIAEKALCIDSATELSIIFLIWSGVRIRDPKVETKRDPYCSRPAMLLDLDQSVEEGTEKPCVEGGECIQRWYGHFIYNRKKISLFAISSSVPKTSLMALNIARIIAFADSHEGRCICQEWWILIKSKLWLQPQIYS